MRIGVTKVAVVVSWRLHYFFLFACFLARLRALVRNRVIFLVTSRAKS